MTFALQNLPMPCSRLRELSLEALRIDNKTAKFDLSLVLVETERGLVETMEYNTDLFDEATISRMLGHFQTLLQGIAADPDRRLRELPLLARSSGISCWGPGTTHVDRLLQAACVPRQLFEAQARRTPCAVAVTLEEEQLTYGELERRANQLAHHLRSRSPPARARRRC